ncbi:MAG TPA: YceI family protein [Nitrospirota bacterium]
MVTWIIDPDHSCATFSIRHMMIAHVRGQFSGLKGTIVYDPADRSAASVEVEIEVAGVTTGNRKRDDHLLTPDFFDQQRFPSIIFKSTGVRFLEKNRMEITGDLTLHGVTRRITLEAEFGGPVKSPYGGEITMGFTASATINREDFGMMWGSEAIEGGGLLTSKEVSITLDVEADRAE